MKKQMIYASAVLLCGVAMLFTSCSQEDNAGEPVEESKYVTVADFEDVDVTLNDKGYWSGERKGEPTIGDWGEENYDCTATSGLVTTHVTYSYMMGMDWYMGIALSNSTETELKGLESQYNNIVGGGADGSKTYAVVFGNEATIDINAAGGAEVSSISMANSAYTMQSVLVGDGFSAKFANAGDHIYVTIHATKADGTTATKTVKLAEYTTELNYLKGWEKIDLSELGRNVVKLSFTFDSHNDGVPTYVCVDNIVITEYR